MGSERFRLFSLQLVFNFVNIFGLMALAARIGLLTLLPIALLEAVILLALFIRFGPRYFPQTFERDPIYRLMRSGRPRAALVAALRSMAVVVVVVAIPAALAIAAALWMQRREPAPPFAVYIGVPSAIWLVSALILLAFRRPLRAWAERRGLVLPEP